MNYTTNYHLPQWEQDDRIMREDFNDNNQKIDAALAEKPYVFGIYTGNGINKTDGGQTITLGFHPRFVIAYNPNSTGFYWRSAAISEDTMASSCGRLTDTGFTVWINGESVGNLNENGYRYSYIAFR